MTDSPSFLLTAAAVAVVAAIVASARGAASVALPAWDGTLPTGWDTSASEPTQAVGMLDAAMVAMSPSTYIPAGVAPDVASRNMRAFLDLIAYSEGTQGRGDDGYNLLFGYGTFDSYADHPRVYVPYGNTSTSAAGRYQILARTWDDLQSRLNLPDFGPASQDAAAIELIRERGALNDVQAGRVTQAVAKVAKVWASLPGAGYSQPERKINELVAAYQASGGTVES